MQRLRARFTRGEAVKYISHLDLMRLWERALRRADIPLAYSQGFSPHPRICLAAPLPLGVTSESELIDVYLTRPSSTFFFLKAVSRQLPQGIELKEAQGLAVELPSLQSLVRHAEYRVTIEMDKSTKEVENALDALLEKEHLPWQHKREAEIRSYDLRALVDDLWLEGERNGVFTIYMRLRCDERGSGRPEQVVAALGFPQPRSIHRTKLLLRGLRDGP